MSEFTPINGAPDIQDADVKPEEDKMEDTVPKVEGEDSMDGAIKEETDEEPEENKTNGKKAKGKKASPKSPSTPKKRGRKPAEENGDEATAEAAEDGSPTKKKRASPKTKGENGEKPGKANQRSLPTSYDNASEEDRMLLRMKDEGKSWNQIRVAWEAKTGDKVGGSTLSGRYARIKANFTVFSQEDEKRLLHFKKEIEGDLEKEKWSRLADAIEKDGGSKYAPPTLQKKFKELSKKMGDVGIANGTEAEGA